MVAALGSCTTAYRSAQTPDDVYYSPVPEQNSYVSDINDQDRNSYSYRNEESDIRRGIANPVYRNSITFSTGLGYSPYSFSPFSPFSNSMYGYNPYGFNSFGYNPYSYSPYGMKGMYSPYQSFGNYDMGYYSPFSYNYSPYGYGFSPYGYGFSPYYSGYSPIFYSSGDLRVNTHTGARRYNLNSYNNTPIQSPSPTRGNAQPVRTETAPARVRNTGVGNVIRRVFTPTERNNYDVPNRSTNSRRSSGDVNTNTYRNNTRTYDESRSTNETRSFDRTPSVSSPSSSALM